MSQLAFRTQLSLYVRKGENLGDDLGEESEGRLDPGTGSVL